MRPACPADEVWTGFTIDYGITEVHGTIKGSDEGLDAALVRALHARRMTLEESPYCFADGSSLAIQLSLIRNKWRNEVICRFCKEAGQSWYPAGGLRPLIGDDRPEFLRGHEPQQGDGLAIVLRAAGRLRLDSAC